MTGAHQWEDNAAVQSGGRNRFERERQITRKISAKGGSFEMDVAFANVDLPAGNLLNRNLWVQNKIDWSCGLTAGKAGIYQRYTKRKRRRDVPANWVYDLQSDGSFQ